MSIDEKGQPGVKWRIGRQSTSYIERSHITTHRWELIEIEELNIETLTLDQLILTPYRYTETLDNDGTLSIEARAGVTEDELRHLLSLTEYFPVIRKGINDSPREMRFGQVLWSQHADTFKVKFFLVDRARDKGGKPPKSLIGPQITNLMTMSIDTKASLQELLEMLTKKGILSLDDVATMRSNVAGRAGKLMDETIRVSDVDEW